MLLGKQPESYKFQEMWPKLTWTENVPLEYQRLIPRLVDNNPESRPLFPVILRTLVELLNIECDHETIVQNNMMEKLKEQLESNKITLSDCDALNRTILHQTCIFGNVEMLEYLTKYWGTSALSVKDSYSIHLTHLAARNGNLKILKFLQSQSALSGERDTRFEITPLDLALSMKHWDCFDFLLPHSHRSSLNSAVLSACSEGQLEAATKLAEAGADLETRADNGATPLDSKVSIWFFLKN